MPQTEVQDPGVEYKVMWRVWNPAKLEELKPCPMPRELSPKKWRCAENLTKIEAGIVYNYWRNRTGCELFEIKVVKMNEM